MGFGIETASVLNEIIVTLPTVRLSRQRKKAEADYSVGERVKHNIFGEGTVLSVKKISNDAMLEIAFDSVGTKKLMANFAKITKI